MSEFASIAIPQLVVTRGLSLVSYACLCTDCVLRGSTASAHPSPVAGYIYPIHNAEELQMD
eukprot:4124433-Amphidinium_carterae.1